MEPMTQEHEPRQHDIFVLSLNRVVAFEDKGIEVVPLETSWGCTVKFRRQNRTLPWRVTINREGRVGIYKPLTSTLPPVNLVFQPEEAENANMMLVNFIQGGWL